LRYNENIILGAQTERRSDAGPVRWCLAAEASPPLVNRIHFTDKACLGQYGEDTFAVSDDRLRSVWVDPSHDHRGGIDHVAQEESVSEEEVPPERSDPCPVVLRFEGSGAASYHHMTA
jgi:hypothetical protein